MSTYLLALFVGPSDYKCEGGRTKSGSGVIDDFLKYNFEIEIYFEIFFFTLKVRVCARKSAVEQGLVDFALEASMLILDFFETDYFANSDAIPPKIGIFYFFYGIKTKIQQLKIFVFYQDLIGIPDFSYSAMENWGMVTFREDALYYSGEYNTVSNKQNVALIIAHELAHFWFGNLVTPYWWYWSNALFFGNNLI